MKKAFAMAWLACVSAGAGQWYFEAGPWYRGGMELKAEGGSAAAETGAMAASPGTRGGTAWVDEFGAGDDGSAQELRTFDNGFVGPSGWDWATALGQSQYFGYESAGQYDAGAGTLSFVLSRLETDVERRTTTTVEPGAAGWRGEKDLEGVGAQATLGWTFAREDAFEASAQVQAGWLDGMDAEFRGEPAWSQRATWTTRESTMDRVQNWTYAFDTLGNPAFPAAPYEMTTPTGVGPMIADRPSAIEEGVSILAATDRLAGRRTATATSRVDVDAEMQAFAVALGPRLRWRPTEKLSLVAQAGVTLNLLDADLERTETFAWEGGGDDRDVERRGRRAGMAVGRGNRGRGEIRPYGCAASGGFGRIRLGREGELRGRAGPDRDGSFGLAGRGGAGLLFREVARPGAGFTAGFQARGLPVQEAVGVAQDEDGDKGGGENPGSAPRTELGAEPCEQGEGDGGEQIRIDGEGFAEMAAEEEMGGAQGSTGWAVEAGKKMERAGGIETRLGGVEDEQNSRAEGRDGGEKGAGGKQALIPGCRVRQRGRSGGLARQFHRDLKDATGRRPDQCRPVRKICAYAGAF